MKTKARLLAVLLSLWLLVSGTVGVQAAAAEETEAVLDGILQAQSGTDTVQQWIDTALPNDIGGAAEWYVIALSRQGTYDFAAYRTALQRYLAENTVGSATTRQKYALTLIAAGGEDPYLDTVVDETLGKQGVMSYVYGLHLLHNGCKSERYTAQDAVALLLERQLADGGWAVMGSVGDVDVTAMVLQALAPYRDTAGEAVDRAVALLSERQGDTGDYESFGDANPESAAQVIVALSALGIDAHTDSRFSKNGHSLWDGVRRYQLEDGTFAHTLGAPSNPTATVQVFCAAVAYLRMSEGRGGLYELSESGGLTVTTPSAPIPEGTTTTKPSTPKTIAAGGYKLWVSLGIAAAAGGVCLTLYLLRRRNRRNFLVILLVAAAGIAAVLCTEFQSADGYYQQPTAKEDAIGAVTLSIRCDTVAGQAAHIPDDGCLLAETAMEIAAGDTVYDVLVAAAQANRLHLETAGSGSGRYVQGIGNLYEFDFGELSGWTYLVNGEKPSVSCSEYVLSAGDTVEWRYSCEIGNDLT